MRVTLDIDEQILGQLRAIAAREGRGLGVIASELLAGSLSNTSNPSVKCSWGWTAAALGQARVDLTDPEGVRSALIRP